jgi:hypothetical protein
MNSSGDNCLRVVRHEFYVRWRIAAGIIENSDLNIPVELHQEMHQLLN